MVNQPIGQFTQLRGSEEVVHKTHHIHFTKPIPHTLHNKFPPPPNSHRQSPTAIHTQTLANQFVHAGLFQETHVNQKRDVHNTKCEKPCVFQSCEFFSKQTTIIFIFLFVNNYLHKGVLNTWLIKNKKQQKNNFLCTSFWSQLINFLFAFSRLHCSFWFQLFVLC